MAGWQQRIQAAIVGQRADRARHGADFIDTTAASAAAVDEREVTRSPSPPAGGDGDSTPSYGAGTASESDVDDSAQRSSRAGRDVSGEGVGNGEGGGIPHAVIDVRGARTTRKQALRPRQGRSFRIRWRGRDHTHDSWLTEDASRALCPDLVDQFLRGPDYEVMMSRRDGGDHAGRGVSGDGSSGQRWRTALGGPSGGWGPWQGQAEAAAGSGVGDDDGSHADAAVAQAIAAGVRAPPIGGSGDSGVGDGEATDVGEDGGSSGNDDGAHASSHHFQGALARQPGAMIDIRRHSQGCLVRVRWRGCTPRQDTWMSEASARSLCPALVDRYWREYRQGFQQTRNESLPGDSDGDGGGSNGGSSNGGFGNRGGGLSGSGDGGGGGGGDGDGSGSSGHTSGGSYGGSGGSSGGGEGGHGGGEGSHRGRGDSGGDGGGHGGGAGTRDSHASRARGFRGHDALRATRRAWAESASAAASAVSQDIGPSASIGQQVRSSAVAALRSAEQFVARAKTATAIGFGAFAAGGRGARARRVRRDQKAAQRQGRQTRASEATAHGLRDQSQAGQERHAGARLLHVHRRRPRRRSRYRRRDRRCWASKSRKGARQATTASGVASRAVFSSGDWEGTRPGGRRRRSSWRTARCHGAPRSTSSATTCDE